MCSVVNLKGKALNDVDHLFLLAAGEPIMERQPDELVADAFGNRAVTGFSAKVPPHVREMQRQIMEHAINPALTQISDQLLPEFKVR